MIQAKNHANRTLVVALNWKNSVANHKAVILNSLFGLGTELFKDVHNISADEHALWVKKINQNIQNLPDQYTFFSQKIRISWVAGLDQFYHLAPLFFITGIGILPDSVMQETGEGEFGFKAAIAFTDRASAVWITEREVGDFI